MSYRTILVHLDDSPRCNVRVDLAAQVAAGQGGHLIGLAPTGWVEMPASVGQAVGGVSYIQLSFDHLMQRAQRISAAFSAHLSGRQGLSYESRVHEGDPTGAVIRMARCSDLAVIGQAEDDASSPAPSDLPQQVVLGAGVPVLVVPYAGHFDLIGRRVLVAWDGSRESTRALVSALPLFERGAKVQTIVFDGGSRAEGVQGWQLEQLRQWFARHGVDATVARETTEIGIGEALLSRAADLGSDLLVMGAYGHTRLAEFVLGGATRTLLAGMALPVLMAH
ncbi:universal stress protein [Schlegelella sp. S2-27]|uniref:Universal stress protein n=1 Tax=Caldimonas mangrovi TaxID=2944811 RepID=A0ABT0YPB5_9BURK|nr:universal stress protein [Caldimonas mangrovi]MCM5680575.1 universal stress protein [Caldimonas mangrovi]